MRRTRQSQKKLIELICEAASNGDYQTISSHIPLIGNIDRVPLNRDRNALSTAATNGHVEIVKLLLDAGANPNSPKDGYLPLAACLDEWKCDRDGRDRFGPTLRILVASGAAPTPSMLDTLVKYDVDLALLRVFLDASRMLPWYREYLNAGSGLWLATSYGDVALPMLRELLQAGSNPNCVDPFVGTPLICSVRLNRKSSLRELLKHRADPNLPGQLGYTPLLCAVVAGDLDVVRELLRAGASVNQKGNIRFNEELIEEQICPGQVNYKPQKLHRGTTALIIAARLGKSEIVELLLECSADQTTLDYESRTALDWAKINKYANVVHMLQSHRRR